MSDSFALVAALIAANLLVWTALVWVIATRRRRKVAERPRRSALRGDESGAFTPLAPVAPRLHAPPPQAPAPDPEPTPSTPEPEPAPPASLPAATTYEIVWYREEERILFALQPTDGRSAPELHRASGTFVWDEDRDPPPNLREAQREHGRLRARLLGEGWTRAGRGQQWFSHRFHPPSTT